MAINQKLSEALRGNKNAAKNKIKSAINTAKISNTPIIGPFASGVKSGYTGVSDNMIKAQAALNSAKGAANTLDKSAVYSKGGNTSISFKAGGFKFAHNSTSGAELAGYKKGTVGKVAKAAKRDMKATLIGAKAGRSAKKAVTTVKAKIKKK